MGTHTIEKIYDEGRAAFASDLSVHFSPDVEQLHDDVLSKYWEVSVLPDLNIEAQCWDATDKILAELHDMEEHHKILPSPPLYVETLNNVDVFKAKQSSSAGSIRLKPRFTKMNKADLLHWLAEKADDLKLKAALAPESDARARELCVNLADEIEASDISFTRKHLLDLCERVWNAL